MTLRVRATITGGDDLEGAFGLDAFDGFAVDDIGGKELMGFAGDLEGLADRLASGALTKRMENSARAAIALVNEVMVRELVSFLIGHTPQWSGDMVTQWHVVPRGGSAGYQRSPYKADPWQTMQSDLEGPRLLTEGRYDIMAVGDAADTVTMEMASLSPADWAAGITILNAHPEANDILHKANARSAWASNAVAYAFTYVEGRYGFITDATLPRLRRRRLDLRRRFGHAVDQQLPQGDTRTGYTQHIDENPT